jgi:protein-tyrosine phosphatase
MDPSLTWSPSQQARLASAGASRSVDIHCHCLPELDDGPATLAESLRLCEALIADGVTTVIATPHQLGGYDRINTAAVIRDAVAALTAELDAAGLPLEIYPGADVRVDERLLRLLDSDQILTSGDRGRHLLLELPHEVFVDPLGAILALVERDVQPLMTHPERHRYLANSVQRLQSWVEAGAALQITAGSLLGDFGSSARQEAWRLVEAGLVSLVATDAHNVERRPPRLTAAIQALADGVGAHAAHAMTVENPLRVFAGEYVNPVVPT